MGSDEGGESGDCGCQCRACGFCCKPKTGSIFVGIVNLVAGTVGIVTLYFILSGVTTEMNQIHKSERPSSKIEQKLDSLAEYYWTILLTYAFPSVLTFLVGFAVILASAKNSEYLLLISVIMNGILIISSFTISAVLYMLSVQWIIICPVGLWGIVQCYFTWVLLDFKSFGLKTVITTTDD